MECRAHDRNEETVVEVVQELSADQRMGDLHHGVTKLQGVHEQHEGGHADPVLAAQGVPVVPSHLDLPGQRGVERTQPRGQHLQRDRDVT